MTRDRDDQRGITWPGSLPLSAEERAAWDRFAAARVERGGDAMLLCDEEDPAPVRLAVWFADAMILARRERFGPRPEEWDPPVG